MPLILACATPSQILADAKVRELCEKDGGITVYETVKLPADRFDKYGQVWVPYKETSDTEIEFFFETSTNYLKKRGPEIYQIHTKLFRRSDRKLLGEIITYSRRGGDLPGPWHPSSFRCPMKTEADLKKQIFIKE